MTITTEQLTARRQHIGSSDAAAICGVDQYRTPADVWAEKVHDVTSDTSPAAELGNVLEPILLDLTEKRLGAVIKRDLPTAIRGVMAANLDGVIDSDVLVEAKTTGITEGWGEPGDTNAVPERVLIQTHHAMFCTGAVMAWVPVLFGKFGLRFEVYRVERNDDLADTVAERCTEFWNQHVIPATCPPDSMPSLEILKRVRRRPSSTAAIDPELITAFKFAKHAAATTAKEAKEAQAALIAAMGDAEACTSEAGNYTYFEQHRKGYIAKASTYRVLREIKQ